MVWCRPAQTYQLWSVWKQKFKFDCLNGSVFSILQKMSDKLLSYGDPIEMLLVETEDTMTEGKITE